MCEITGTKGLAIWHITKAKWLYMGNEHTPETELDLYRKDLSKALLSELVLILQGQEKLYGKEFAQALIGTYLASFVSTVMYNGMADAMEKPDEDSEIRRKAQTLAYHRVRELIESSVSCGIENGMSAALPGVYPDVTCSLTWNSHVENGVFFDKEQCERMDALYTGVLRKKS